jgi:hypothetical protein
MADVAGNPVGSTQLQVIDHVIKDLLALWDQEIADKTAPWWKFWVRNTTLHHVTEFLLRALDTFILEIDEKLEKGPDKKATVLAAIAVVYDTIIVGVLPIYLKPFSGVIRDMIIFGLLANAIDMFVSKYRAAEWMPETPEEPKV